MKQTRPTFISIVGVAASLPVANIDTDQILPSQFLTTLTRTGLAGGLFHDMRFDQEGAMRAEFVLNRPEFKGTKILIAGPNFGCGSSREHAPWALIDFGVRCVIAPSFGEIFRNNCFSSGILPITLSDAEVALLMAEAQGGNHTFQVDLENQTVLAPSGAAFHFDIGTGQKGKLLEGLDEIGLTLKRLSEIEAFEQRREDARSLP